MPLKYKDAIYYRQGVGAFTTGYRCKRRKLGCNGMVKFPVSNTHPDRPVTSELLEFRPHADGLVKLLDFITQVHHLKLIIQMVHFETHLGVFISKSLHLDHHLEFILI